MSDPVTDSLLIDEAFACSTLSWKAGAPSALLLSLGYEKVPMKGGRRPPGGLGDNQTVSRVTQAVTFARSMINRL